MPRGKKKDGQSSKIYFGEREERAVEEYLSSTDQKEKEEIFTRILYPALSKLVECVINRYKLYPVDRSYEAIMQDALTDVVEKFKKFNPAKKTKAFSYFGTVCKHYAQNECEKAKKNVVKTTSYNDGRETDNSEYGMTTIDEFDIATSNYEDIYSYIEQIGNDEKSVKSRFTLLSSTDDEVENEMNGECDEDYDTYSDGTFAEKMIGEMVQHISSMMEKPDEYRLTDKDIQVGQAITMLLSEWERMYMEMCCENEKGVSKKFTKNTVMYYLRETTCLSTNDVRKSLKKYKNEYASLKKKVIG